MKAIFVIYNQVLEQDLEDLLDKIAQRGFTRWDDIRGRGSDDGEPRMGTHTWPGLNGALLCMVEEERVDEVIKAFRELDKEGRGLRAFAWDVQSVV